MRNRLHRGVGAARYRHLLWALSLAILRSNGVAQTQLGAISPSASTSLAAPATAATTFHDSTYKVAFDYPANWTLTHKDHEVSTFRLDARTAGRTTKLRAVASIPENPFPASTFSGAYVYLSVTPRASESSCARQTVAPGRLPPKGYPHNQFGSVSFVHGHDEQKAICTTARDEIYTALHRGACFRFDLAINNFCGGAVSGVKDITPAELDNVRSRMEAILSTVRFDPR